MDVQDQRKVVEGLTILIENSLNGIEMETDVGTMRLRVNVSSRALDLAEKISYFPKSELDRFKTFYGLAEKYVIMKTGLKEP